MKQTNKCPKCGSRDIAANAKAITNQGPGSGALVMSIATYGKPEALLFKEKHETTVSAWVCAACGFVEFYADYPSEINPPKP